MTALRYLTGFAERGRHVAILQMGRSGDLSWIFTSIDTDGTEMQECLVMEDHRVGATRVLWNPPVHSVLVSSLEVSALWSHANAVAP